MPVKLLYDRSEEIVGVIKIVDMKPSRRLPGEEKRLSSRLRISRRVHVYVTRIKVLKMREL